MPITNTRGAAGGGGDAETMNDLEGLLQHARRVRAAIEAVRTAQRTLGMRSFRCGACWDASLLLGAHLADNGIKGFEYICGERGDKRLDTWTSHAWLQRGTCIIDITADRFDDAPAAIIVAQLSVWHASFRVTRAPEPADFRLYTGPGLLHVMYARMRHHL